MLRARSTPMRRYRGVAATAGRRRHAGPHTDHAERLHPPLPSRDINRGDPRSRRPSIPSRMSLLVLRRPNPPRLWTAPLRLAPADGFEETHRHRAGWSGSAASRWRSAASSWCAIRSRPACSAPKCARCWAACSRSALLLAGEWTRRKESISAIAATPIANIPAILTAAGTAVAFATVYAAYALYGFLVPGHRLHPAGTGGDGHAGRGAAARPGARRPRRRRRVRRRRSWSRPASRTSGRSISISPSSRRPPSAWRASGCGAGWRSPPSCSRCCGPSPACNADPSMVGPHAFHVLAGLHSRRTAGGVRLPVRPAGRRRPDRADLVGLARGLSARRDA